MQSDAHNVFIEFPDAAQVVVGSGETAGEIKIGEFVHLLESSVNKCEVSCASPCVPEVWTIQFNDVDFGACNSCGKSVGFGLNLERNNMFSNQDFKDHFRQKPYSYGGTKIGLVSAEDFATYFYNWITKTALESDKHDQFGIEVVIDPLNLDTLIVTLPCDGLVTYMFDAIYHLNNNNLSLGEMPVFTKVTQGVDALFSYERLLQRFPVGRSGVWGEAPRPFVAWCGNVCVIRIKGCIPACSDFFDNQNSGHLHKSDTPYEFYLWVNSSAPGYPAFIAAINAAFTACTLSDAPGIQGECYQEEIVGASVVLDIDDLVFNAAPGNIFTIDNGAAKITVTGVTDGADLAAKLTAAYPSGTFTFAVGPPATLTVGGPYVANAGSSYITLCRVIEKQTYVGE